MFSSLKNRLLSLSLLLIIGIAPVYAYESPNMPVGKSDNSEVAQRGQYRQWHGRYPRYRHRGWNRGYYRQPYYYRGPYYSYPRYYDGYYYYGYPRRPGFYYRGGRGGIYFSF